MRPVGHNRWKVVGRSYSILPPLSPPPVLVVVDIVPFSLAAEDEDDDNDDDVDVSGRTYSSTASFVRRSRRMGCEGGEEEGDDDDDDAIVHAYSIFVGRRREETFEETARPEIRLLLLGCCGCC